MAHSVTLLRRTEGGFIAVPSGSSVSPGEGVRYQASGVRTGLLIFQVKDDLEQVVFNQQVGVNVVAGEGWADAAAPLREARYTLVAISSDIPFIQWPRHEESIVFGVKAEAPAPPSAPPSGGLGGVVRDVEKFAKTSGFIGIALLGLVVVAMVVSKRR